MSPMVLTLLLLNTHAQALDNMPDRHEVTAHINLSEIGGTPANWRLVAEGHEYRRSWPLPKDGTSVLPAKLSLTTVRVIDDYDLVRMSAIVAGDTKEFQIDANSTALDLVARNYLKDTTTAETLARLRALPCVQHIAERIKPSLKTKPVDEITRSQEIFLSRSTCGVEIINALGDQVGNANQRQMLIDLLASKRNAKDRERKNAFLASQYAARKARADQGDVCATRGQECYILHAIDRGDLKICEKAPDGKQCAKAFVGLSK